MVSIRVPLFISSSTQPRNIEAIFGPWPPLIILSWTIDSDMGPVLAAGGYRHQRMQLFPTFLESRSLSM